MFQFPGRFRLGLQSLVQHRLAAANNVFFGGWGEDGRGEVVVTDGQIVGVIPVIRQDGGDEAGPIPVAAWNRAMAGTGKDDVRQVQLQKNWVKIHDDKGAPVVAVPRGEAAAEMPDYKSVIPPAGRQKVAVTVNPQALSKLSRVLGSPDRVTLHMDADPALGVVDKVVRVTPEPWGSNDHAYGAMLPILIEKDRQGHEIKRSEKKKVADTVAV